MLNMVTIVERILWWPVVLLGVVLNRPALLEHMPLIETHHHTLENGLDKEEEDDLLGGDPVSRTNQQNLQQQQPQQQQQVQHSSFTYGGCRTRMVYLDYITCLRYNILLRNSWCVATHVTHADMSILSCVVSSLGICVNLFIVFPVFVSGNQLFFLQSFPLLYHWYMSITDRHYDF